MQRNPPIEALSGGSNLATALSLKDYSYRAMSTPLKPPYCEFYLGNNNSNAGGPMESLMCPSQPPTVSTDPVLRAFITRGDAGGI